MGLDHWLVGKKYLSDYDENKVIVHLNPDILCGYKVEEITIKLVTWRKANAIHKWFVDNIQEGQDDCKEYYVDIEQLENLYNFICKVIENHSRAEELLPAQSGFFFGGTEYDDYYFHDLERTKTELEKIINNKELQKHFSIYYSSSW